jgi:hypothetical protein
MEAGRWRWLPGFRISPRFFGADPDAPVLGQLAGLGQPGLVVKQQPGWIQSLPLLSLPHCTGTFCCMKVAMSCFSLACDFRSMYIMWPAS